MRWGWLAAGLATLASAAPAAAADGLRINVLSTRADLVSDGQALVSIDPVAATVTLNGRDVTTQFAVRRDGRFAGLLTGLVNGPNTVTAKARGSATSSLTIVNHPRGGPIAPARAR